MAVRRIYAEKRPGFDLAAQALAEDIRVNLSIPGLTGLRILLRYDIEGLTDAEFESALPTIFSEPNADIVYKEQLPECDGFVYAVEYLPGQFDQCADSAAQCCSLLTGKAAPMVRCAKVYVLQGSLTEEQKAAIRHYTVNPVEARPASLDKVTTLEAASPVPDNVRIIKGFTAFGAEDIKSYHSEMGFAMSPDDLAFVRDYFKRENRDPFLSELKVIDTYWSDHCRHTTFLTRLKKLQVQDGRFSAPVKEAYSLYLTLRGNLYANRKKDVTLMDIATIAAKEIKRRGGLADLDESEEINACSVLVDADINGKKEKWVVMFKNETHNHPTEIEPFGGAATCLGGAIRDPLSGRSYVYQAMRVTGSGSPLTPVADTLHGKLPQRKITLTAAAGYSSYGNQIGLSTGQVSEVYDEGYVAKRLEIGAVVGAAPAANIRRERPVSGDVIVLLGGATGRDGCGGATGSSKAHTGESLEKCGAEVQKGNPPTERKLQRLMRKKEAALLIKRCNDFGAGGVCVAIGELAEGLDINLDAVPKKYDGLDGTELAISESQERMAVVLDPADTDKFIALAAKENLAAVPVALVTDTGRLRMSWRGEVIVDLKREFLDTNGITQEAEAYIEAPDMQGFFDRPSAPLGKTDKESLLSQLSGLAVCSQKGLSERFDSTIGRGTVLLPFGGKYQLTPACAMAAKLPVEHGDTDTVTIMSWGFNPALSKASPFHGAYYAVAGSLIKLACAGGDASRARLTQQEYFERLRDVPSRWGKPAAALLGSLKAQLDFNAPSIGGKDSMSGSFNELDVPPTLVNFAIVTGSAQDVISPEFKKCGSCIGLIETPINDDMLPDAEKLKATLAALHTAIKAKKVLSACPVGRGGLAATAVIMSLGNRVGAELSLPADKLFRPLPCAVLIEADSATVAALGGTVVGKTGKDIAINGLNIGFDEAQEAYTRTLNGVFPIKAADSKPVKEINCVKKPVSAGSVKIARPKVIIPVFPGTNCEVDSARAFEDAGAQAEIFVLLNSTPEDIKKSSARLAELINQANILMLPGGFSGGDEPDGSGKFIATVLRNPAVSDAVMKLLTVRDGLVLGICNGFQALIKTGLLPYGEIKQVKPDDPTLTFNTIGRHISTVARVRVAGVNSPWLSLCAPGEVYSVPVSHGEGRFAADGETLARLIANGQIATQYCSPEGIVSADGAVNLNGSAQAIEGIVSPDGRILGKMGHTERAGKNLAKNVEGNYNMRIFEAGVQYFK